MVESAIPESAYLLDPSIQTDTRLLTCLGRCGRFIGLLRSHLMDFPNPTKHGKCITLMATEPTTVWTTWSTRRRVKTCATHTPARPDATLGLRNQNRCCGDLSGARTGRQALLLKRQLSSLACTNLQCQYVAARTAQPEAANLDC